MWEEPGKLSKWVGIALIAFVALAIIGFAVANFAKL
jgi:hypothetical protein